jgi:hypothetical protein
LAIIVPTVWNVTRPTHHIINVIIRADFPVQRAIQLANHKVSVTFILHEFLQAIELQPTDAFSFKYLIHNLLTKQYQILMNNSSW